MLMPFIKGMLLILININLEKSDKEYSYFAHFDDLVKVEKLFTN